MKPLFCLSLLLSVLSGEAQEIVKTDAEALKTFIATREHPTIIAFWATWCKPCLNEIPWLQEAVSKDSTGATELVLVSLDLPSSYPNKLQQFISANGYKARMFWLSYPIPGSFFDAIHPRWEGSLPSSLWINKATGYRNFYGRQLTPLQIERELKWLNPKKGVQ